jgi:hypothetical protein
MALGEVTIDCRVLRRGEDWEAALREIIAQMPTNKGRNL